MEENLNYLLVQRDRKFEFGAVLIVFSVWYNAESWSPMPRAMLSRHLLVHRKRNCTKDASVLHFMVFLILQQLDVVVNQCLSLFRPL